MPILFPHTGCAKIPQPDELFGQYGRDVARPHADGHARCGGGRGVPTRPTRVPGWAPDLSLVLPLVHAKAVTARWTGLRLGNANLDITARYWESELLVVEGSSVARVSEARVDELVAGSVPVERGRTRRSDLARARAEARMAAPLAGRAFRQDVRSRPRACG